MSASRVCLLSTAEGERMEVRGNGRSQKSEVRSQKSEGRRQKAEGRRQKAKRRSANAEGRSEEVGARGSRLRCLPTCFVPGACAFVLSENLGVELDHVPVLDDVAALDPLAVAA